MDEGWEWNDGQLFPVDKNSQCCACDLFGPVDDLGLCEECRTKLEPGTPWVLIRQRDWDYSAWAFGLSEEGREELYRQAIAQHGKKLELIASDEGSHKERTSRRHRK